MVFLPDFRKSPELRFQHRPGLYSPIILNSSSLNLYDKMLLNLLLCEFTCFNKGLGLIQFQYNNKWLTEVNIIEISATVNLRVLAGVAKPNPKMGQALGPLGGNMMKFCE